MKSFVDRVVVVSGAGSGIGRACALAYGRAGARLHLVDLNGGRLQEVRAALEREGSAAASCHALDCSDSAAVEDLAAQVYRASGRVDVLQNGVGVLVAGPVERLPLEDWRRAVEVNLWSTVAALHAFLPRMLAQGGGGHVVNVASFSGLVGFPYTVPYTATKFALVGLSEALAAELYGRGLRVTAVCPGAVRTRIMADGTLDLPGGWKEPLVRAFSSHAASPERVARQVLRAVRRQRPLVIATPEVLPLWWLKRASLPLYDALARRATRTLMALANGGGKERKSGTS